MSQSHDAVTVILSHNHVSQWKIVEDSGRNDINITCYTHVDLKKDTWSFRVG